MAETARHRNGAEERAWQGVAPTFDRAHLMAQAMQDEVLAAEVLNLFLMQLPKLLEALAAAATPEDWHSAAHALKGAAASIGAPRLQSLAAELEARAFSAGDPVRQLRLQTVAAAALAFRVAARGAFPGRLA